MPDSHKHCPRADHPVLAELFIAGVDDQIGIFVVELAPSEASQFSIQSLIDLANRARTKTVPAELFADCLDFPGRYPWMYIWVKAATKAFSLR
jgi:hypothetical protein